MEISRDIWSARGLQPSLGYAQWRRFEGVIRRAMNLIASGESKGMIRVTSRAVSIGSGAVRKVSDYEIDRDALRLIQTLSASYKLNNHFPIRNEAVLLRLLEKYCKAKRIPFEYQGRRGKYVFDCCINHHIAVEFDEPHHHEGGRVLRTDKEKNRAANDFGLEILRFTLEHDIVDIILAVEKKLTDKQNSDATLENAGIRGLYNGVEMQDLRRWKGIHPDENLMDRMDTTELAAHQFRMTQMRDKLAKNRVKTQQQAIRLHEQVGREVRAAIQRIGGTMPENIKPAEHIKAVEKRLKQTPTKLALDGKDARGLSGEA